MSVQFERDDDDDAAEDDSLLVEWAAELAVRIRNGQSVDWEELAREHPERAEAIRRMRPAFGLMARMGSSVHRPDQDRDPVPDPVAGLGCLGDYKLLREVGRGGMGVVYEAHQISLKRRVALKVLPFASALDSRHLQRFQIEAQAAAALNHKNIVPVFTVSTEAGVPFYAMQFIEGRSLAEVVRELRQLGGLEPARRGPACAHSLACRRGSRRDARERRLRRSRAFRCRDDVRHVLHAVRAGPRPGRILGPRPRLHPHRRRARNSGVRGAGTRSSARHLAP